MSENKELIEINENIKNCLIRIERLNLTIANLEIDRKILFTQIIDFMKKREQIIASRK